MHIIVLEIEVKPEFVQQFIAATLENARATTATEPGNLRFDVLQHQTNPAKFVLYEVYTSAHAHQKEHRATEHYKRWRDTVEPWMSKPRIGTPYRNLFPKHPSNWNTYSDRIKASL